MLPNPHRDAKTLDRKRLLPRCSRPTDGSNRGQRMLQVTEHVVVSFSCPFLLGRPGARVLLPRARDALLGETFRGNRQSRGPLPAGRRVLTRSQAQQIRAENQGSVRARVWPGELPSLLAGGLKRGELDLGLRAGMTARRPVPSVQGPMS
jgi:hypothetical protein